MTMDNMADDNKKLSQYITARDFKNIKKILHDFPQLKLEHREILYGLQTPPMRICHCNLSAEDTSELINIVLQRQYDVNIQDGDGKCLLSHACISQKLEVIQLLSNAPSCYCNPNIPDNDGNTALFFAVRSRNPVLVDNFLKCFIEKSLNLQHRNSKGLTVLEEAEMKCDREICHLLKRVSKSNSLLHIKQSPNVQHLKLRRSPTPEPNHTPEDRRPTRLASDEVSPLVKSEIQHPLDGVSLKTRKKKKRQKLKIKENNDAVVENEDSEDEVFRNENVKNKQRHTTKTGITPRERKNSFSLPDLSVNNGSLVSSSPSSASGKSDFSSPMIEISKNAFTPGSDEDAEESDNVSRTYVKRSNRKASLSLPELRIDQHVPNGVIVEKKAGGVYITSLTPRKSQTKTGVTHDLLSNTTSHNGATSERYEVNWNKRSKNDLTLPQIDTTPRTGYPSPRSPRKSHVPYH